ncbi:MAG: Agmatine deiminase [Ignavibacteriaceae bacterium]|nr:Agmatine deiminase [Ignavibacteriaceae bacterium]
MKKRIPAEWEQHESTLIAWPHNKADWPGKFTPITWVYADITAKLSYSEKVRIVVQDQKQKEQVQKALSKVEYDSDNVVFHVIPTDRSWMRDSAPIWIKEGNTPVPLLFRFNAWAKYDNYKQDEKLGSKILSQMKVKGRKAESLKKHVVLEGGAIDYNGSGLLLTTEECLLDPLQQVRNPGWGKKEYEQMFAEQLGIKKVIWLDKGIAGDDTHGHVDDLARFVNENTILLCSESDSSDENYDLLQENMERLKGEKNLKGESFEIIPLPMPDPVVFDGMRLPASYANFYIGNQTVIVPTFNDAKDYIALGILRECFPDRKVVGIHSLDLVWGLGTLHCLTHEIPA